MKALTHDGLTAAQYGFCKLVARGTSLTDAYKNAYNCRKALAKTINRKAAALYARPEIRTTIEQLVSASKIQDIDSVGAAYADTLRFQRQAVEAGNWTAAGANPAPPHSALTV